MTLSNLTSLGDTLFVTYDELVCSSQLSPPCATAATTSDGGVTWSRIRPMYQGEDLQIIGGAAGALLALPRNVNSPTRALLRSTDGGTTWTALPVLPGGVRPSPTTTFALPDGTTIAQVNFLIPQGGSPISIYKLSAGTTAWVYIAPPPPRDSEFHAVSWDAAGHPLALWTTSATSPGGVYSHPT